MAAPSSCQVSVVIPVWGPDNLPQLVPSLKGVLESMSLRWEIVVAAGPGRSRLRQLCEALGITLVTAEGTGYGRILREGLARARGDYVVTMDADFSHRPGYLRTMWDHRERGDVLLGSRHAPGAWAELGPVRRRASRTLNLLYRKVLSLPYRDISSGFRMYRRSVLEDIGPLASTGFDILPEMVVKAHCQGWQIAEVPFWYRPGRPWTRTRALRLGAGYLRTLRGLVALRNSVRAADYGHRAFDSWIPLQRYWQRRRFRVVQGFVPDGGRVLDIGSGSKRIYQAPPRGVARPITADACGGRSNGSTAGSSREATRTNTSIGTRMKGSATSWNGTSDSRSWIVDTWGVRR
jgi:dolichol-phosphate mannosyltransferase